MLYARLSFDWLLMRSPVEAMAVQQGEFVAQYTDQIDQVNESYLDNIPLLIEISSKTLIVSAVLFWLDYRVALLTLFLLTMPLYIRKRLLQKSSALVITTWNTEEYDAGNRKGKTCSA